MGQCNRDVLILEFHIFCSNPQNLPSTTTNYNSYLFIIVIIIDTIFTACNLKIIEVCAVILLDMLRKLPLNQWNSILSSIVLFSKPVKFKARKSLVMSECNEMKLSYLCVYLNIWNGYACNFYEQSSGLVQERHYSIVLAMVLRLFWTNSNNPCVVL